MPFKHLGLPMLVIASSLLYVWLRPQPETPLPGATTEAAVAVHDWVLEPAGTPRSLQIHVGDVVRIVLAAGPAGEVHVHGLGEELTRRAGQPATLTFMARHSGHFEAEWHEHGQEATLGALDVYPR